MSEELLRELLAELRGIRSAIEGRSAVERYDGRSSPLGDSEQAELVRFVAAISAAIGDRLFLVKELIGHADTDSALRAAIIASIGGCDSSITKRLGKRLQRASECPLRGYRVRRAGTERNAALWQIIAPSRVITLTSTLTQPVYGRSRLRR